MSSWGKNGGRKKKLKGTRRITRRELKEKAVKYLGSKCTECGYNKCIAALEFHHRDPNEKDYSIGKANANKLEWWELVEELDKCDLVCSNCHREIHEQKPFYTYKKR